MPTVSQERQQARKFRAVSAWYLMAPLPRHSVFLRRLSFKRLRQHKPYRMLPIAPYVYHVVSRSFFSVGTNSTTICFGCVGWMIASRSK